MKANVLIFDVLNHVISFISLLTVLEDFSLGQLVLAGRSPHVIACVLFIFLYVHLKQFIRLVYDIVLPWNN